MNNNQWLPIPDASAFDASRIKRINVMLVVVPTAVVAVVGFVVGAPWLAALVMMAATALVVSVMRAAEHLADGLIDVEPADETRHARIINVVEGLCVVSGDRRPQVMVVHDASMFALAVGGGKDSSSLVVSDSLLDRMDRLELEAVAAHMLWRLRIGEVALTTYAIALTSTLSRFGLGALARRLTAGLLAEKNDLWADVAACQATRYPPALISALQKCAETEPAHVDPVLGPLMLVNHFMPMDDATGGDGVPKVGTRALSVEERIAVLKEI